MTDFDKAPPMPVDHYRDFQRVIPGLDDLYHCMNAIVSTRLIGGERVLVVGAGGGREVESLAQLPLRLQITGVDPSHDMLELARAHVPQGAEDRVELVRGLVEDLPESPAYAAATAILVTHFLPDDGAKARLLSQIRSRLDVGGLYLHVDVAIDDDREFDRLAAAVAARARAIGLPEEVANGAPAFVERMRSTDPPSVISTTRTRQLLSEAGFEVVSSFFTGFWYRGWWAEASALGA